MIQSQRPRLRAALLLSLTAALVAACAPLGAAPADEAQAGAQPPGSITTHLDGRMDFFTGVGGSH
ncbi:hypothetical protein [Acidisoma sp. 7E03]